MNSSKTASGSTDFVTLFFGSEIRPFLVATERTASSPRLVIHTAQPGNWLMMRRRAARLLRDAGIGLPFRIRRHSGRDLDRARSLEEFVADFRHDRIEHDPTGAFVRADRLVAYARALRGSFGSRIAGIYWNSRWRSIYLVLDPKHYVTDRKLKVADLAEAEILALEAMAAEFGGSDSDFRPSLRLGFHLPSVKLVPVDRQSYARRRSLLGWLRGHAGIPVLGALVGLGAAGTAATAADLPPQNETYIPYTPPSAPAVSEPNGKMSLFGGVRDQDNVSSDGFGGVEGSYSIPLGYAYGAQVDGLVGLRDGDFLYGLGGHLFWRDPTQGLIGVEGVYVGWDADAGYTDLARIGVEGEYYLEQWTLVAQAGVQFGKRSDDGFYGGTDLRWYATPDWFLEAGVLTDAQRDFTGHIATEFQAGFAGIPGLTLYADAAAGDDDYYRVYGGVRIYFGAPKSLIERHRYDDPLTDLLDTGSQAGPGNVKKSTTSGYSYPLSPM